MSIYEAEYKVDYTDINQKNELTNIGFLKYLQETGCLHSDKVGMGLYQISQSEYAWVLIQWKLKVLKRPRWNEKIKVKTWPSGIEGPYCLRDFEIFDDNNQQIAIATSKWIIMNMKTEKIEKITPRVAQMFQPIDRHVFPEKMNKLREPENYDSTFSYTALRRDIDTNQHVNNVKYLEIACEVLPEEIYFLDMPNLEITYKHECKLGQNMTAFYTKMPQNEHIVTIKYNEKVNAIIKLGGNEKHE